MIKNQIEIDEDLVFHQRFWKVQRLGWVLWALILVAAVIGFLGPGAKGQQKLQSSASNLSLTFEKSVHYQAPAELKIQVKQKTKSSSTRLAINRDYIDSVEITRIDPEPNLITDGDGVILYTFNRSNSLEPMTVNLAYKTKTFGRIPIRLKLDEEPSLIAEQLSFP
jgi:hypothetical protein